MLMLLLACAPDSHPTVREGRAEYDPNVHVTDADDTGDTASPEVEPTDDSGGGGGGEDTAAEPDSTPVEVCYPGADRGWTACLPLVTYSTAWGADYSYPAPYNGSAQYSAPARYIDLSTADPDLLLAPNFALEELMQEWKGRYGLFQVHTIVALQAIRDATGGPLTINSGYRNVAYNESVGGVTYSRHQYGDAADMASSVVGLSALGSLCEDQGAAYVGMYTTHVHCDWRDDPLDEAFYDARRARAHAERPVHGARLAVRSDGRWTAPATGFDEGEPLRIWAALAGDGTVLEAGVTQETYMPPPGAARVRVWVGGQVTVEQAVGDR